MPDNKIHAYYPLVGLVGGGAIGASIPTAVREAGKSVKEGFIDTILQEQWTLPYELAQMTNDLVYALNSADIEFPVNTIESALIFSALGMIYGMYRSVKHIRNNP